MPRDSPTKEKGRHSDPSTSSLTPILGNFHHLSTGSRARSLSPRKRPAKQPLHIRMNLTEAQMDKITDAVTHKVNGSPAKTGRRSEVTASNSPHRHNQPAREQTKTKHGIGPREEYRDIISSPTFSELMPSYEVDPLSSNLAGRRCRQPLPPVKVGNGPFAPSIFHQSEMEAVDALSSPLSSSTEFIDSHTRNGRASCYSQDGQMANHPSPLNLRANKDHHLRSYINNAELSSNSHWVQPQSPEIPPDSPDLPQAFAQRLQRSKSIGDGLRYQTTYPASPPTPPLPPVTSQRLQATPQKSPLFSPLPLYFRSHDFPTVKKGEKTMIGQNGWLERTDNTPNKEIKAMTKKTGILDSIKKIAKDMTELHHPNRRAQPASREASGPQMSISLDARQQSLLYCELEFHLTNAVNDYITTELDRGHLDPDKFKKIADAWQQYGRPRVVGFRYDLETQVELVSLHIEDFVFYGRRQGNPLEISGLLHAMKVNARAMRIRTFCQPDSVIAKQLVDSQSFFNLINAPRSQNIALAEIAQFFKVIIEREMSTRGKRSRDARQSTVPHGHSGEIRTTQARAGGDRQRFESISNGYDPEDDVFAG